MRVKSEQVVKLLNEKKSPQEIAHELNAKVAVIKRHIYRLEKEGKYKKKATGFQWAFDNLDDATNFWIERLEESKKVPSLEEQVATLTQQLDLANSEIDSLKEFIERDTKRKKAYKDALSKDKVAV